MMETIEAVRAALGTDRRAAFDRRVERAADSLRAAIRAGEFDASAFAIGLELEGYVVDGEGRLAAAPERLFETDGCSRELGVHNAELHTDPDVVSDSGLRRQAAELRSTHQSVQRVLRESDRRFVLDAMWTVPPETGTRAHLGRGRDVDGVFLADEMRPVPRYVALDQVIREANDGRIDLGLPGLESAESMLVESLATSMQPHLQVPDPADVPRYLNVATRTMGPILSLSANSPFLPADLYDEALADGGDDFETLLAETPQELRIPVFERAVDEGSNKCRVPRDVETIDELIRRIEADPTLVAPPELDDETDSESRAGDDDSEGYAAFAAKRGTYWRWVRPVFGGEIPRGDDGAPLADGTAQSVRIEYRPLPTQPTIRDTIGMQALVAGVLRGVDATDHPLATLPWDDAKASFYAAVDDGPDADLRWVTRDGERTTATSRIHDELFALARRGLDELGVGDETIEWALGPIEARREATHAAPSAWKRARVREAVADGASPPDAIAEMQREYVDRAAEGTPFARW
ncbi:hypothetical protein [Halobellus rufus]|uniref:hypothetical protein n=1 Tax=Halobellus rufus TaxID=1448860 RepID=UPI0006786FA1|nr:hypothetical protein [Halobellus rufus]